jgi:hypothetical protein
MKAKPESFELTPVQMWLVKLRARIAIQNRCAARPGHPTTSTFMPVLKPTS